MRINLDYLRGGKEISCLIKLALRGTFFPSRVAGDGVDNILIVSTCLIGEFVASMPAIADFIQRNKGKQVDLLVAPSQKSLAERIIGVRKVYTAKPAHGRAIEEVGKIVHEFAVYERTIALRVSPEAYRVVTRPGVSLGVIQTRIPALVLFGVQLVVNSALRRSPKQWREVNFEFLGGTVRTVSWQEVVRFTDADYAALASFDFLETNKKKVLLHTNAEWSMKCWSQNRWVVLLKQLHEQDDFQFIFIGAGKDETVRARIAAELPFGTHSVIGKVDLAELLLLMTESDYFLGVDSGPSSLSHLADLRSLTIFGMGPHMFLPYNPKDVYVDKSHGRGLFQMFFARKNSFISRITVGEVFDVFVALVRENPPKAK